MAFGDVLAGWGEAAHEHAVNLLQMQQQSNLEKSRLFAKMGDNEDLPPEARSWLYQGAMAHANATNDPKTAKQFDIKDNTITIPVQHLMPSPAPPPVNVPGSTGAQNMPIGQQLSGPGQPQQETGAAPQAPPNTGPSASIAPQSVQPPTPPPTLQTVQQSPFLPMRPEEKTQIQAQRAGAIAGAQATAQIPAKMEELGYGYATKEAIARLTNETNLAKIGQRPIYDINGNQIRIEKIPDAELGGVQQSVIEKNKSADQLMTSKEELNRALAGYDKSKTDPDSPINKQILARIDNARMNIAISQARLGVIQESELARYHGVDIHGNKLPGAVVDPVTGVPVGVAFQRIYQPTAATLTKAQTASPVISQANDLIDFARDPENAYLFGKFGGRWTELMAGKIGTDDAKASILAPKIRSLAALLAPLHGFRGMNAPQEFARTMPIMDSPEAFAAAVREYSNVAYRVADAAVPNAPLPPPSKNNNQTPAPNAPRKVIDFQDLPK